jgi:hypothetical protein
MLRVPDVGMLRAAQKANRRSGREWGVEASLVPPRLSAVRAPRDVIDATPPLAAPVAS